MLQWNVNRALCPLAWRTPGSSLLLPLIRYNEMQTHASVHAFSPLCIAHTHHTYTHITHTYIHLYSQTHTNTHKHKHRHKHAHTHTQTQARTHTHTDVGRLTHTQATHTHTGLCAFMFGLLSNEVDYNHGKHETAQ